MADAATRGEIYQIKVTLKAIEPAIWRRVQVRGEITLRKLHDIVERVMGWTRSHMHEFIIRGERFGMPGAYDFGWDLDTPLNEKRVRLNELIERPSKFGYVYDFFIGDNWEHELKVEKILPAEEGEHYPRCVAGERACPPEACGGVRGYAKMLETLADPDHPEREELLASLGGEFDAEHFDLQAVNRRLRRLKS